ncbi:aminoacetone oxidase family FAD-binding enzyme [bacterium]|nr:aminoacetone oxidase family FAD-binding enzyme [bacterium]
MSHAEQLDIAIVGAGAAGLAAGIFAAEAARAPGARRRIAILDGARKPGAKILVSGGGRCNVTNVEVTPEDYNGGSKTVIRNVLRAFDHRRTLAWMKDLGVELKLEETGKYFPVSDNAHTVLRALFDRLAQLGVEVRPSCRVTAIRPEEQGFRIDVAEGPSILARTLIMATGGLALPKSGSDGAGLVMLERLGHRIVPTTPALVPLLLGETAGPAGAYGELSGLTLDARLRLADAKGRAEAEYEGSLLFTHFGLSGPTALNISRHWLRRRLESPGERPPLLFGHPKLSTPQIADEWLRKAAAGNPRRHLAGTLHQLFPERLARVLAGDSDGPVGQLPRDRRLAVAQSLAALALNVTGDRGYTFAETTAGGVDLGDIDYASMESRRVPGLFLCGELLDVDGRIGGFNFQWAWATGYLAGRAAARRAA